MFHSKPATYNHVEFRSRLEARWAAFFDVIDRPWQYEPLELPGWIPDFLIELPDRPKPYMVEVKPIIDWRQFEYSQEGQKVARARCKFLETEYFDNYDHSMLVLGLSPRTCWCWHPNLIETLPCDESFDWAWKQAGNTTQWKPPT